MLQEDIELRRHVLEEHPVVVALLDLAHLLLEEDTRELPGLSGTLYGGSGSEGTIDQHYLVLDLPPG